MYGATALVALVALVDPDHKDLWVANLGDCQASEFFSDLNLYYFILFQLSHMYHAETVFFPLFSAAYISCFIYAVIGTAFFFADSWHLLAWYPFSSTRFSSTRPRWERLEY